MDRILPVHAPAPQTPARGAGDFLRMDVIAEDKGRPVETGTLEARCTLKQSHPAILGRTLGNRLPRKR